MVRQMKLLYGKDLGTSNVLNFGNECLTLATMKKGKISLLAKREECEAGRY